MEECVHDRAVAAQPVERGPSRFESGIENVAAGRRGARNRSQSVERAGPGKYKAIDVATAIENVLLGCERAHAVAEKEEEFSGIFGLGNVAQSGHVFDQKIEAAFAKIP